MACSPDCPFCSGQLVEEKLEASPVSTPMSLTSSNNNDIGGARSVDCAPDCSFCSGELLEEELEVKPLSPPTITTSGALVQ